MTRRPETGGARQQVLDAGASDPGVDRPPNAPGVALPADLGRSLRLLDDDGLDRLMKAVTEEARRRGRSPPEGLPAERSRPGSSGPRKKPGMKKEAPGEAGAVTPGQERLILASYEAGLKPAAIAREVRVSRPTVQHVITAAKRQRRRTER